MMTPGSRRSAAGSGRSWPCSRTRPTPPSPSTGSSVSTQARIWVGKRPAHPGAPGSCHPQDGATYATLQTPPGAHRPPFAADADRVTEALRDAASRAPLQAAALTWLLHRPELEIGQQGSGVLQGTAQGSTTTEANRGTPKRRNTKEALAATARPLSAHRSYLRYRLRSGAQRTG